MLDLDQKIKDLENRYQKVEEYHPTTSPEALLAIAKAAEVLLSLYKEKEDRDFTTQAAEHLTTKTP